MNWIKDNLIYFLAILTAALGVALLLALLSRANLKTEKTELAGKYNTLKADFSNVKDASDINKANVESITKMYNQLVEKRRLEQAEAAKKAEELDKLKAASAAMTSENQRLREKLATTDTDVRRYLDLGLPQPLACQLWPEAEPCQ